MLLTDYEKMFRFILEDRGFKSAASAARDIGMTRANFNTLLKTRNLIKPSYISAIEDLGYDLRIDLIRRLPDNQYKHSRAESNRLYNLTCQAENGIIPDPIVTYEVRRGRHTVSMPEYMNNRFITIPAKSMYEKIPADDLSGMETVYSTSELSEARRFINENKASCTTQQNMKQYSHCILTFDILLLVKVSDPVVVGKTTVYDRKEEVVTYYIQNLPYERRKALADQE